MSHLHCRSRFAHLPHEWFHNLCKTQQTKKKSRRVSTPACQLAAAYVRPVAHMYTQCTSVALQCAYATCAQQIVPSDWFIFPTQVTFHTVDYGSDAFMADSILGGLTCSSIPSLLEHSAIYFHTDPLYKGCRKSRLRYPGPLRTCLS